MPTPPYDKIPGTIMVGCVQIAFYALPHTELRILGEPEGHRKGQFLFSSGTVTTVRDLYNLVVDRLFTLGDSTGAYERMA